MTALAIALALLCGGAAITLLATKAIEWAYPARGRFIDVGGIRQHVVEIGDNEKSPPIILLHGAGCNLEDMRAIGERLAARHRVILVDRPGHGWSERTGKLGNSPACQAAILRGLLDRLVIDRAVVVGHSWGTVPAAALALDHPQRVAGLVLIAPPTHPRLNGIVVWLYTAFAAPLLGQVFASTFALPLGAMLFDLGWRTAFLPQSRPRGYLRRTGALLMLRPATFLANARDVAGLRRWLARQVTRYGSLSVPTVVISGDRDHVISARHHAMAFAAAVPGAKLIMLPRIGHMMHWAAADAVVACIANVAAGAQELRSQLNSSGRIGSG